jgi:hypothetical protein
MLSLLRSKTLIQFGRRAKVCEFVCACAQTSEVYVDDFTTLKQFVMGLRDLFDSFKLADPTNAVFDAVEAGLSKQDTEYGKSKVVLPSCVLKLHCPGADPSQKRAVVDGC